MPAESDSNLRAVRFGRGGWVTPDFCACCGAPAASSTRERKDARAILVPYCVRCLRHASARTTRNLAAGVASCLAVCTLALGVPLAWPSASLYAHLAVVLLGAALPLSLRVFPRRPEPGHAAAERAVWWLEDGRLACADPRFSEALAVQTDAHVEAVRASEPRFAPWLVVGPVVALIAGPSSWLFHHPLVRVLNLTEGRMTVSVDGRMVLTLEPSSAESPTAGGEVRMPSGVHELSGALHDGSVSATRVTLESGATHLFAPGSSGHCFWLEETRYGRDAGPSQRIPLTGESRFWVLPRQVDTWFAPNPPPLGPDRRSSGGTLVALRQAPCAQLPRTAR